MAEREHQADRDRPLPLLHELAGDVIDGGDVVCIDGVPQPKAVGQKRRPQQDREVVERDKGPKPGEEVRQHKEDVDREDPMPGGVDAACCQNGKPP